MGTVEAPKDSRGSLKGGALSTENPYDIDPERLRIERNILIGTTSTAASAGLIAGKASNSEDK